MLSSYEFLLYSSLYLALAAALLQLILAVVPRFSLLTLLNALLLATAFVPLAIGQLGRGTRVGTDLWLGNCLFLALLLARLAWHEGAPAARLPVLGSLLGLLAFGLHVLLFAASP